MIRGAILDRIAFSELLIGSSLIFLILASGVGAQGPAAAMRSVRWMPQAQFSEALEDDHWDARDPQNRPLSSGLKRAELRDLFVGAVIQLLVKADLRSVADIRIALEKLIPGCQRLTRGMEKTVRAWAVSAAAFKRCLAPPDSFWRLLIPLRRTFQSRILSSQSPHPSLLVFAIPIRC